MRAPVHCCCRRASAADQRLWRVAYLRPKPVSQCVDPEHSLSTVSPATLPLSSHACSARRQACKLKRNLWIPAKKPRGETVRFAFCYGILAITQGTILGGSSAHKRHRGIETKNLPGHCCGDWQTSLDVLQLPDTSHCSLF